jgi:hypothetical protein
MKSPRRAYATPKLVVHGTFEEITRAKVPLGGDGRNSGEFPPHQGSKDPGPGDGLGDPNKS